jgi:hypothetical protein
LGVSGEEEGWPPPDLAERRLPLVEGGLCAGPWCRTYRSSYDPVYFGRSRKARFDDPEGEYGVLYAASDEFGAFIESFGREPGKRRFFASQLANRRLAVLGTWRELKLVDLRGSGLARLGATGEMYSGRYELSQAWSRALYEHSEEPDGIAYRLKHDPDRYGIALFERMSEDLVREREGVALENDVSFRSELRRIYDFRIVD